MSISPVVLYGGATSVVATGGASVVAVYAGFLGGEITNPYAAVDQGLAVSENLYVSFIGPALLSQDAGTVSLAPGQSLPLPAGGTLPVYVNAASSGHAFSVYVVQPPTVFPPISNGDTFPPATYSTLTQTLPSYVYQEYNDDDDIQAFIASFNDLAQSFVDWFAQIGLPIYTGAPISGELLDWVATGLYGYPRPSLPSGGNLNIGPLNTYALNTLALNVLEIRGPQNFYATNDDIYKRCLTWHFYKGDGKVFNIRWLKRRVARFLEGIDGTAPNIDETYQISVSFGPGSQVNIGITAGTRTIVGGALFDVMGFNDTAFNELTTTLVTFIPLTVAPILQAAINSGVLELPFQFTYVVNVG